MVEESVNGSVARQFTVDDTGRIATMTIPSGGSAGTYLVTWNGHGDALGLWKENADGTLALANSFTYGTWGTPTTTVAGGFSDLGFRYLYVGAGDVQWDNAFGLGSLYMHARHMSPTLGRFIQPDPARADRNLWAYASSSPLTFSDPSGLKPSRGKQFRHWVIEVSDWMVFLNAAALIYIGGILCFVPSMPYAGVAALVCAGLATKYTLKNSDRAIIDDWALYQGSGYVAITERLSYYWRTVGGSFILKGTMTAEFPARVSYGKGAGVCTFINQTRKWRVLSAYCPR